METEESARSVRARRQSMVESLYPIFGQNIVLRGSEQRHFWRCRTGELAVSREKKVNTTGLVECERG